MTVVFADLAGSTALGERIDPEDVRALQGELFELVNGEVERFGGVSEKFVGDAILAVFGIPQTHEDDAERAVRAALAMLDAFPASRRRSPSGTEETRSPHRGQHRRGDRGPRGGRPRRDDRERGRRERRGPAAAARRARHDPRRGPHEIGDTACDRVRRATRPRREGQERPEAGWGALAVAAGHDEDGPPRRSSVATTSSRCSVSRRRVCDASERPSWSPSSDTPAWASAGCSPSSSAARRRARRRRALRPLRRRHHVPAARRGGELARGDPRRRSGRGARWRSWSSSAGGPPREQVATGRRRRVDDGARAAGRRDGRGGRRATCGAGCTRRGRTTWRRSGARRSSCSSSRTSTGRPSRCSTCSTICSPALEHTAVLTLCPSRPELARHRPSWGRGKLNTSSLTLAPLSADDADTLLRALLDTQRSRRSVARPSSSRPRGTRSSSRRCCRCSSSRARSRSASDGWIGTDRLAHRDVPDSIHGVIAARIDLLESRERDAVRRCSVMGRVFWPSAVGVDDDVLAGLGTARDRLRAGRVRLLGSARVRVQARPDTRRGVRDASSRRTTRAPPSRGRVDPDARCPTGTRRPPSWSRTTTSRRFATEAGRRASSRARSSVARGRRCRCAPGRVRVGRAPARPCARARSDRAGASRALLLAARADIHCASYERAVRAAGRDDRDRGAGGDPSCGGCARLEGARWWLRGYWREALDAAEATVATLEGCRSRRSWRARSRVCRRSRCSARFRGRGDRRTGHRGGAADATSGRRGERTHEPVHRTLRRWQSCRRPRGLEIIELASAAGASTRRREPSSTTSGRRPRSARSARSRAP